MNHFHVLFKNCDVVPIVSALDRHPVLWNQIKDRSDFADSPHRETSDIWVRYNDFENLHKNPETFNDPHIPVWYPAWEKLPELKPIIFALMKELEGEMIGCVLITKVPAGKKVYPHVDKGWHVEYYEKIYIQLQGSEGCDFCCEENGEVEKFTPQTGQIYLFDNRKTHWVENNSNVDRMTLIVCIRTQKFGRK